MTDHPDNTAEQAPMIEQADRAGGDGLLPCPFCGNPAKVCSYRLAEDSEGSHVECTKCFARTDGLEDAYADRVGAIDLWNRHAAPPSGNAGERASGADPCPECGINRNSPFPCEHTQPAPDALREATIEEVAQRIFAQMDPVARKGRHEIQRMIRALSSAPVPSGEEKK